MVKPISVLCRLQQELSDRGVSFLTDNAGWVVDPKRRQLCLNDGCTVAYGHLINCAGLQADRVAHMFGVGHEYTLLPFKGLYWQLKPECLFTTYKPLSGTRSERTFSEVLTPNTIQPQVSIGPTATLAWGRENYRGLDSVEPVMAISNLALLARQYLANKGGFRRYVHEQAFLGFPPLLLQAAQQLIPALGAGDIELRQKVVLNSYSVFRPAPGERFFMYSWSFQYPCTECYFASFGQFALADLILDRIKLDLS